MKFIHPNILFLDEDLEKSAQYLTNNFLDKNIKSCCHTLMNSLYYMIGIRSKKFHKFYFSKDRKKETMDKWFPTYPFEKVPSFVQYNSQESRWCRKCKNHYDYVLTYLECLFNEYSFRFNKDHELYELLDFFRMIMYEISIKYGIKVFYVKGLKIILPWKSLPLKYRKKDILNGYRLYYINQTMYIDPFTDFTNRKIPDFFNELIEY